MEAIFKSLEYQYTKEGVVSVLGESEENTELDPQVRRQVLAHVQRYGTLLHNVARDDLTSDVSKKNLAAFYLKNKVNAFEKDHNGATALLLACRYGNDPVVEAIKEHCDEKQWAKLMEIPDDQGNRPIHWCWYQFGRNKNKLKCAKLLMQSGCAYDAVRNNMDQTPKDMCMDIRINGPNAIQEWEKLVKDALPKSFDWKELHQTIKAIQDKLNKAPKHCNATNWSNLVVLAEELDDLVGLVDALKKQMRTKK